MTETQTPAGQAPESALKVLYIAGMNRSGSTLLGRLLNELPGAAHVGELGLLLDALGRGRCGCRLPIADCPFWGAVLDRAFGGLGNIDLAGLRRTRRLCRIRGLPRLLAAGGPPGLREYLEFLGALYGAAAEVAGARVLVDGSKDVIYGALLRRAPGVSLRPVHLVRDSRAVAHSFGRVKGDPPLFENPGRLEQAGPARTAVRWAAANLLLEAAAAGPDPPARLRYEDLIAAPAETVARLWAWIGEPPPPLDFLRDCPVRVRPGHTVAGNPDRFADTLRLRLDDAWRAEMAPRPRALVTALTLPLLLRYGYLRPAPRGRSAHILPPRVL